MGSLQDRQGDPLRGNETLPFSCRIQGRADPREVRHSSLKSLIQFKPAEC